MGKYAPLGRFLRRRRQDSAVLLSFDDIERIIAAMLPKAAWEESWWSNQRSTARGFVQCRAWLDAGFDAQLIGRSETVRFQRQVAVERDPANNSLAT